MCDCPEGPVDPVTDYAGGAVICTACGVVVQDLIFERTYHYHDYSTTTEPKAAKRRKTTRTSPDEQPPKTAEWKANAEIEAIARSLAMPKNITDTAKEVFRDILDKKSVRETTGKMSRRHFIVASVYLAFRINGIHRSLTDVDPGKECIDALKNCFDLLKDRPYAPKIRDAVLRSEDLVFPVVARFELSLEDKRRVLSVVHRVQEKIEASGALDGRTPRGILSGILHATFKHLGILKDKKTVAEVCGVSAVTMLKLSREIEPLFIDVQP